MKSKLALTLLLLCLWVANTTAQTPSASEPRVTITKRTYGKDGSSASETIVKKGQAAKDFDVDKYLADNRGDDVSLDIRTEGTDEERHVVINGKNATVGRFYQFGNDVGNTVAKSFEWGSDQAVNIARDFENEWNRGYLGVDEDSDEDDEPGVVVDVSRNSAAAKAGIRTNDVITALNDEKIEDWDDLSKYMRKTKVGDKVKVTYTRNGKSETTEVTLGGPNFNWAENTERGYLGVDQLESRGATGKGALINPSRNTAADKAGLKKGDLITKINDTPIKDFEDVSDFMEYTKPGETVTITYSRNGETQTTTATLGKVAGWSWGNGQAWSPSNNSNTWIDCNSNTTVRTKEACLGVYTTGDETEDEKEGARITGFTDNSAAEAASFSKDDVILSVNGERVSDSDELWSAIAKFKIGDKVEVKYDRNGKTETRSVELRACDDESVKTIFYKSGEGNKVFEVWNWDEEDRAEMRKRPAIPIRKGTTGDAPGADLNIPADNKLAVSDYKAYPNPATSVVTVEFKADPVATVVGLYDLNGRQLFREELNAFNGSYNQQFDLTDFAKGSVVVRVQQGPKVFVEKIVVN